MVWSLALCLDDAKQDPVAYGAEFGVVVFLAEGPRTASIQEGLKITTAQVAINVRLSCPTITTN